MTASRFHRSAVLVMGLWLGGCAGASQLLGTPPTGSVANPATGAAPPVASANETFLSLGNSPTIDVSATDLYARVAGGALKCWFGAGGPLKATHVFNADAAPAANGGAAEIIIHERDPTVASQAASRGTRAFRVRFEPVSSDKARLGIQPGKLAPDLAAALEKDVLAYAFGRESCEAQVVRPPPPPPTTEKKKPARPRPPLRATTR